MPLKHGQRLEPPGLTRGCSSPDSAGRLQSSDSVRLHRRPLLPPPALPALRGHAPRLPTTTAPRLRASCPCPRRPWFLHLCGPRGSAAPNLPCHRGSPGFNPVRALAARRPNRPAPVAYPAFPPCSPSPLNQLRQPTPPTPPAASGSSRPGIAWPRTTPSNHHGTWASCLLHPPLWTPGFSICAGPCGSAAPYIPCPRSPPAQPCAGPRGSTTQSAYSGRLPGLPALLAASTQPTPSAYTADPSCCHRLFASQHRVATHLAFQPPRSLGFVPPCTCPCGPLVS